MGAVRELVGKCWRRGGGYGRLDGREQGRGSIGEEKRAGKGVGRRRVKRRAYGGEAWGIRMQTTWLRWI